MKGLVRLLAKELTEQLRTYRLLVVGSIFVFFGITTPLMLKYLPEIIKLAGAGDQIPVNIPPPTAVQSLVEYSGNIGQIGALIAVLVAMGSVANEVQRGTAVIVLSKPVTRAAFITAKLSAMSLTFIVSTVVASVFCFGYTVALIEPASVGPFVLANALLALFLIFSLAVTLLFSSLFTSSLAAGGVSMGVIVAQAGLSVVPVIGKYMPGKILGWGNALISGDHTPYWWALGVTLVLTPLCVYFAQLALKKKDI